MFNLPTLLRVPVFGGLIATAALSGVAHADTSSEIARFDAKSGKYCVTRMITGSLLPQRICATRQGWIDMGSTAAPTIMKLAAK